MNKEPAGRSRGGRLDEIQVGGSPVIAPEPTRHYRARVFQIYLFTAAAVFIALAVAAHFIPHFEIDLKVTRAIQGDHGAFFDGLMRGLTWMGFAPQVEILTGIVVVLLFALGLKWEAVMTAFAGLSGVLGILIKLIVLRPRPTADLVKVASLLNSSGFPSGHVLTFTAFAGFLLFLAYTLLKPGWLRTLLTSILGLVIVLMSVSRIYLGHHWFSDVMGAYLLGSIWLALNIKLYHWGKKRFYLEGRRVTRPRSSAGSASPRRPSGGKSRPRGAPTRRGRSPDSSSPHARPRTASHRRASARAGPTRPRR